MGGRFLQLGCSAGRWLRLRGGLSLRPGLASALMALALSLCGIPSSPLSTVIGAEEIVETVTSAAMCPQRERRHEEPCLRSSVRQVTLPSARNERGGSVPITANASGHRYANGLLAPLRR